MPVNDFCHTFSPQFLPYCCLLLLSEPIAAGEENASKFDSLQQGRQSLPSGETQLGLGETEAKQTEGKEGREELLYKNNVE